MNACPTVPLHRRTFETPWLGSKTQAVDCDGFVTLVWLPKSGFRIWYARLISAHFGFHFSYEAIGKKGQGLPTSRSLVGRPLYLVD
jgi:hypothetical protein